MKESHGIVVTDLAFLPDSLNGRNLRGDNETAMLSVAVDSRCQVHAVPNASKPRVLARVVRGSPRCRADSVLCS